MTAASLLAASAYALPQGGQVVGGQASFSSSGSTLTVTQSTDRAILNWHSFDIGVGEAVSFVQPSRNSVTLNRATGSLSPSQILGSLSANGTVLLVNPNGIFFGPNSQVNVGSLVATTADISDDRFMAGDMRFDKPGNPNAGIVNQGLISVADVGLASFVAPNVVNDGLIQAKLGKVQLASGDTFALDLYGDGLVSLEATDAIRSQLVSNSGIISAQGGQVTLTAAAAGDVVNSLINMDGIVQATSVAEHNGEIIIYAEGSNAVWGNNPAQKGQKTGSSTVLVSGVLDASGRNPGERGGNITVTGDNVALLAGAIIEASGHSGLSGTTAGQTVSANREGSAGGDIRIGGDYLGQGSTPTAQNLYVDPRALIVNDSLFTGDAGRTIFWSDGTTQFYGNVYARALGGLGVDAINWGATAGGNGGDGGFVETSGEEHLDAGGYVNLTASNGQRGTYFLDPTDITINGNVISVFNNSSLAGYWSFDEGTGTSIADSSGNGNAGTLINGPAWSSAVAPTPQANAYSLSFDGVNDRVSIADHASLDLTSAVTVSAWVRTDTQGSYKKIVIKGTSSDLTYYISQGDASFRTYLGIVNQSNVFKLAVAPSYLPTGNWVHLAGTYDGSFVKLYWNGVEVASTAQSGLIRTNNQSLTIGAYSDATEPYDGLIDDVRLYSNALSANDVAELYGSRFTVAGIEKMSQTANVSIQASNNITLDLAGDTLDMTAGRNLTLTAGNQITTASAGTINTTNGAINLTGTNGIVLNHAYTLNSSGGSITLTTTNAPVTFASNVTLGGNTTITAGSGAVTFGGTVNGGFNLTVTGGSIGFGGDIGNTTPLATVSLTSANDLSLPSITAGSIFARTTGAASDLAIASGKVLTASGTGTPITLVSGRNFINNAGSGALSTPSGRWLVYSTNPANDTTGSLASNFRRFTCAYGGSCPSLGSGNGLLYSYTPTLTASPSASSLTYGDAAPNLTGYSYGLTGYLGSDSADDTVAGSLNGSTAYSAGSNVGNYAINYASGTLASALGYGFSYANNATGITIGSKTLTAGLTGTVFKRYDGTAVATLAPGNYTISGVFGSDDVALNNPTTGAYDTPNSGSGKLVTVTGLALVGSAISNYTLSSATASGAVGQIGNLISAAEAYRIQFARSLVEPSVEPRSVIRGKPDDMAQQLSDPASLSPAGVSAPSSFLFSPPDILVDPELQDLFNLPPRL